jgi:hypothetical protein
MLMAATAGVVLVIAQEVAPTNLSGVETIGDILGFLFVMMLGAITVTKVPGLAEALSPANLGLGAVAGLTSKRATSAAGSIGSPARNRSNGREQAVSPKGTPSTPMRKWSSVQTVSALAMKNQRRKG